jgi:RNA polymerase sigma-70 factor (ECF subfamily)
VDEVTVLALAARDGDRVALSSFIRRTWGDVARFVTAVAGADLAEDAAQDTYLRALKALPAYRGDAAARTWLPLADGVLNDQLLGRLDVDRRTAFVLTQMLGFDYASAAEVCGCPVGTIRSRVARAREQLVAALQAQPQR